ncbi:hypothetical protein JK635_15850 [Neobacillus sp. YIM B02564]|jgi:hypothetical protein|uniref:DUF5658 domain-containing protein n=1 Tax=Neobacillus paridis TaxID=2803862 RepID=A0ABS1TQW1_9BACI|nr:DUF5658 family protein [Neobacillus paridis]MBL4953662.1 hypothetical protein [Neobacillus paridis]
MRFCLFLLFAGTLDAVLTHFGVTLGIVEEANPLMKLVIEKNWSYFYLIKISLPLLLIGLFLFHPVKKKMKLLLVASCFIYFSVLVYHLVWMVLYLNA